MKSATAPLPPAGFTPVKVDPQQVQDVCNGLLSPFFRQLEVCQAQNGDGATELGAQIHGHMMAALCMAALTDQAAVTAGAVDDVVRRVNDWLAKYKLAHTKTEGRPC